MNIDKVLTADLASRGAPRLVMTTDKMKTVYLDDGEGKILPLRKTLYAYVSYAADGTQTTLGTLPANSAVMSMRAFVRTAFNAGTTNTLAIGTAADPDMIGNETTAAAVGWYDLTTGISGYVTSDTALVVTYNQTGTAASTGSALVVLEYATFPAS